MGDSFILSLENQWKTKTFAANELFKNDNFSAAMEGYNIALSKAEALNIHKTDCLRIDIPLVQIFIISCNNIAYTFEAIGDFEATDKMLKRSVYYLLSLVNSENSNPNVIQSELKRATLAYSDFIDKQNGEKRKKNQVFEHLKDEFLKEGGKVYN